MPTASRASSHRPRTSSRMLTQEATSRFGPCSPAWWQARRCAVWVLLQRLPAPCQLRRSAKPATWVLAGAASPVAYCIGICTQAERKPLGKTRLVHFWLEVRFLLLLHACAVTMQQNPGAQIMWPLHPTFLLPIALQLWCPGHFGSFVEPVCLPCIQRVSTITFLSNVSAWRGMGGWGAGRDTGCRDARLPVVPGTACPSLHWADTR